MKTFRRGWFKESTRHSLAARGIPSGAKSYAAKKDSLGSLFDWTHDKPKPKKKAKKQAPQEMRLPPETSEQVAMDEQMQLEKSDDMVDWQRIEREAREAAKEKGYFARKFVPEGEMQLTKRVDELQEEVPVELMTQSVPAQEPVKEANPLIPQLDLQNPEMLQAGDPDPRPQVLPMGVGLEVGRGRGVNEEWIPQGEYPKKTEFVTMRSDISPEEAQREFQQEMQRRKERLQSLMLEESKKRRMPSVLTLKQRSIGEESVFSDAMLSRANKTYFDDEESAKQYAMIAQRRPEKKGRVFVRKTDSEFDKLSKSRVLKYMPKYVVEEEVLP